MSHLVLQSKAKNLEQLQGILKGASVLKLLRFSTSTVRENPSEVCARIASEFEGKVIVRSSAQNEDSLLSSNAGAFLSLGGVDSGDERALKEALARVAKSMGEGEHELFIQPMLQNITLSGVMMSVGKEDSSPYVVINFEEGDNSDGVTSGTSQKARTFCHFRGAELPKSGRWRALLEVLGELEEKFACEYLDVEFAFAKESKSERLYILQVRPIVFQGAIPTHEVAEALEKIAPKIAKLNRPHPNLLGNRTIFGVMPDWNPAEIIGTKPRYLALSLYKELVTDSVWAYQRSNYGYRNLRSHPLLVSLVGMPYVDTRVSFNSFIPQNLSEKIAEKLANFYLDKLAQSPENHDKVEFEIILSCYHFNLEPHLAELRALGGLSVEESKRLEFALLELTNRMIDPKEGLYRQDLEKIKKLEEKFEAIESSELADIDKIYWGVEYCKRYGTLPFAGVARAAFVAVQMLNSLVAIGFFSQAEREEFLGSLATISKRLALSSYQLAQGVISKAEFLREYGHLRSGTYSILSPTYAESFESYFGALKATNAPNIGTFTLSSAKERALDELLESHGLRIGARAFLRFIKEAIEGRESVKFAFTKVLSRILERIEHFGARLELSKEELAHLDIKVLLGLYANLEGIPARERLRQDIAFHQREFTLAQYLKLPPLLIDPREIYDFILPASHPNFITQARLRAEVIDEARDTLEGDLRGKIVCVKSADPGYDFLFAKGIAGLITCYGGVNSHMAIRCAEARIPAVIGAGEEYFALWSSARFLEIDGVSQRVEVL